MENLVNPGIYKHFKGGYVLVLFCAKHSDRDEVEVVYKGLNNGKFYARPIESFCEIVETENGKTQRFIKADINDAKDLIKADETKTLMNIFN